MTRSHDPETPRRSYQLPRGSAALLFALSASAVQAQSITSIGALGPTASSEAFALSADGSAVVGYASMTGGALRAVRWTSAGLQNLGTLPGGVRSLGFGVSGDGSVVTGIGLVFGAGHIFRWTADTGMQDLGTLPIQNVSYGFAISTDGLTIAGGPSSGAVGHALTWTAAGGLVDRGALPGHSTSGFYAVSADGLAATGYSGNPPASVAVRWTSSGGMENLGTLPGGANSEADAISADGGIVAGWSDSTAGRRAFRWTPAGEMQDLGVVTGRLTSSAAAISADGSVVAGSDEAGAIIWTSTLGMTDLAPYLAARGVNLSGWTLQACYAISADGTALAGTGRFNGVLRGWVVRGIPSVCEPRITTQPQNAIACATGTAGFSVAAEGSSLTYEWQIETDTRSWISVGHDPVPLECGGSAFALFPNEPDTAIGIRPCPGITSYHVRCLVSSACGTTISEEATYTICAADFNCSNTVDSQDFFDFITAFFSGESRADFNADGAVNSQDFFDFLSAFFTPC